jgi:hypothetical protein
VRAEPEPGGEPEPLHELRAAVGDAWREGAELVRQHAELASREAADRTAGIGVDAAFLVSGLLCLQAALIGMLAAAAFGLYQAGVAPWLASLSPALTLAIVGGAVALWARRRLQRRVVSPSETLLALRETGVWLASLLGGAR